MANLVISTVCNQNCPYCFTLDHRDQPAADRDFLDQDEFETRLQFLDRSGINEIRFLGGEPTLHPRFVDLVKQAQKTGKHITVFSNGLMPEETLVCLESLPLAKCTVLVNVSHPLDAGEEVHARRKAAMHRLAGRVMPGFNIYRPDFQLEFLLPLVTGTGCQPRVRLGLAQPCLSGGNQHVHPNQYPAIGRKIVEFARLAADAGVTLEFDCGFVRCMFSDSDLVTLKEAGADVGWRCNPILDVDIAGQVIHCFPLSGLGTIPLTPEIDAGAMRSVFEARARPYRQAGVYQECSTCSFKTSGECPGGCLAATMRRFRHTPFELAVPHREVAE